MKKLLVVLFSSLLILGTAGLASATPVTVSFVDSLENVDVGGLTFSNNDTAVNLGTTSFTILSGFGTVASIADSVAPANLSHRWTRGLGVWGGVDNDEIDSISYKEKISISFDDYVTVNSLTVRSLFTEDDGVEQGRINFFKHNVRVDYIDLTGNASGELTVLANSGLLIDEIRFVVPLDQVYTLFSEFAVTELNINVPEPATLLLLGFGLLGIAGLRRKE